MNRMENIKWIIIGMIGCFICGIGLGISTLAFIENKMMEDYDLYNCIYNNADMNDFTDSPYLIEKIQNECICFRKYNYTDFIGKC